MNKPKTILRALEPEDLEELYAIENDRSIWNVGSTNVPYSRYVLHDYIANASSDIFADRQVRLMIVGEKGENVGVVDVVNFDPRHRRAEIGIVIKQAYRRLGYGRSAVEAVMGYARDIWHLHQLYVIVDVDNTESVGLFEQLGFSKSSQLHSWLYDGHGYRDAMLMQTFLEKK